MPFGGVLSFLCLAPFVVPGIVLAIGFYAAYASRPLALYGTAAIMILAFTTRFLPIAYANSLGRHPRRQSGDGGSRAHPRRRRLTAHPPRGGAVAEGLPARRLAPGLHPGDARAVAAVFLYGPNTRVMSVMLLNLTEEGVARSRLRRSACCCWSSSSPLSALGYALMGRDFMERRSEQGG